MAMEDTVSAINRVVVLYGETGSGKITEAGQFIFEYYIRGGQGSRCNMLVTQPRRMAAISMAKRAALEWHEELSDTVGFHVRLTKQLLTSRGGKLFCTAGILLRPLQQNVELQGVSHVIVDEVHERDVCTDFLLVLLREVLSIHRTFQVILMHATTNTDKFSEYFDDAPVIVILGKAHPVTRFFLDDLVSENIVTAEAFQKCASDAVRIVPDVFMHIVEMKPSEAIFCFLPGWNEINKVRAELCEGAPAMFDNWNLPLQSRLRYQEQQKIFENPPAGMSPRKTINPSFITFPALFLPADVRKVILSTNLAETSVTVDDVVYVVGTGLHRDQCLLGTFPTSMASVQQRAGRAGRVRSGESCHLITQNVFLSWDQFKRPEIQTTDLTTVVLDCKTIVANAPHLPDDEIEAEASGRDVVRDNAGAERTVYDIMTGRQLTVSSKSNPRIDRELMAKVEKSWKCYQRARLQHPIFARSSEKPRLPGAENAASIIGLVVECGAVAHPDYSIGVLAGNRQIHPRDKETCLLTMLNCVNPESNSNRDGVVTPSSCLRRLHVREDIVSAINRVVVICGETGSGKTTQAAQFTFEDYIHGGQGSWCNIVFTQLRRIAAISLAKRVAHERHEEHRSRHLVQQRLSPWQHPVPAVQAQQFKALQAAILSPPPYRTVTYRCHTGELSAHPTLGSPQGSPIGPLLWNIVISGLLDVPLPPGVGIQAYADDPVLVVPGENRAAIERTAALARQRVAEWSSRSKVIAKVQSIQRLPLIALTGAYRTTCSAALQVLARAPPLELELDRLCAEFSLFQLREPTCYGPTYFHPVAIEFDRDIWLDHPAERHSHPFRRLNARHAVAVTRERAHHVYTGGYRRAPPLWCSAQTRRSGRSGASGFRVPAAPIAQRQRPSGRP
ncbi:uncharacterized protein LOC125942971 [Dermacentor silvarum]|uniref:uncharacterized protein LOC125942971 n=1 Tax=Dermacentor silvarum TaxID=543639 RepID=UPI002101CB30|nr:uncharacterized protein LOC125942971 [Dermacentor silvarum]